MKTGVFSSPMTASWAWATTASPTPRALFARLKGLRKSWGSQVCITIAEHDDLLRAAAEAGANTFYIGFESIDAESLKSVDKKINLRPIIRNYKKTIKKIHDHGIGVIGGFILGTDGDTKDIFDKTIEFIHETGIDGSQFTIMTPFPGHPALQPDAERRHACSTPTTRRTGSNTTPTRRSYGPAT